MKAPKVLEDLFSDLRDKRLLPLVALLAVAIVAAPIILGGDDSAPPASGPSDGSAAAGSGIEPAPEARAVVVAAPDSIRDFRERLNKFKRRNPFRQQLDGPTKAAEQAAAAEKQSAESSASGGSGGSGGAQTKTPDTSTTETTTGEVILFTWRVDVKVGPVGDGKKEDGVKQGGFLPGRKRPVVQFLEGDFDETEALFLVSPKVDSTSGEGLCAPNRAKCEFVLLKKGEEHRFEYEPDGRTYRLKLRKVILKQELVSSADLNKGSTQKLTTPFSGLRSEIRGR